MTDHNPEHICAVDLPLEKCPGGRFTPEDRKAALDMLRQWAKAHDMRLKNQRYRVHTVEPSYDVCSLEFDYV